MQASPQLQPVIDGLAFAEAPRWHGGKLWFSDMYTYSVHCLDADGQLTTVAKVPGKPSGLGWRWPRVPAASTRFGCRFRALAWRKPGATLGPGRMARPAHT